jgi:hypothetical protein
LGKLAGVGGDGVAGGHSEVWRELIEREPADLPSLARFAVFGAAAGYAAQIGGRNPVLALLRQEVICNAKEGFDGDSDANFFESFADGTVVQSFEVFELAADDAPGTCFGRQFAEGEERAAAMVENEDPYAYLWQRECWGEIVLRGHRWRWNWAPVAVEALVKLFG